MPEHANAAKQESASSESESEEEAEYRPNVSVSFSHTQIPEVKEEEEEEEEQEKMTEEKKAEEDATVPDVPCPPAEVSQPVEAPSQEEETRREEAGVKDSEKEGGKEAEESTDDPMVTPEETPNGLALHEESVTVAHAPAEEEEEKEKEPKMNGEASLVEAEPRPQVICCSEVKSSPGRPRSFPGLRFFLPAVRNLHLFFLPAHLSAGFLPACVNI